MTVELNKWKADWKQEAEQVVNEVFPKKVMEVTALLESGMFDVSRVTEIRSVFTLPPVDPLLQSMQPDSSAEADSNSGVSDKQFKLDGSAEDRVFAVNYGPISCNAKVMEMAEIVKPIVREMVENVNKVKMWILFLIPKIEDGNNFGVQIQEEALSEARIVENDAASFLDNISRYLLARGRLVCRCVKYPHVIDFQQAVRDMDEKAFIKIRHMLTSIRNHYGSLHDMIIKNIKKIKTPRSANAEHLY